MIRLTVPDLVLEHVLAPVLPRFFAAHPKVSLPCASAAARGDDAGAD